MRLFVAVELPEIVRERLSMLCAGVHGAKWVDTDQMHVTLRFLGEVDGAQAEDVADALARIRAEAFTLELSGIGDFSSGRKLRVLWVGVAPSRGLAALQSKIEQAARRAGIEPEKRKFHAHVTLARFAGQRPNLANYLAYHEPFRAGPIPVRDFVLFSSLLGSEHAVYHAEARYPLINADAAALADPITA